MCFLQVLLLFFLGLSEFFDFFRFFFIVISYFDILDSNCFPYGLCSQIVELCVVLWWVLFVFPGYLFVVFSPSLFVVHLGDFSCSSSGIWVAAYGGCYGVMVTVGFAF